MYSGKTLRLRVQMKGFEAICKMIEAGLGIGLLPKISAETLAQKMGLKLVPHRRCQDNKATVRLL